MEKKIYNLLIEHARLAGLAMGCLEGVRYHDIPEEAKECIKRSIKEIDDIHKEVMAKYWED